VSTTPPAVGSDRVAIEEARFADIAISTAEIINNDRPMAAKVIFEFRVFRIFDPYLLLLRS
jgi:hypothetical protein